MIWYGREFAVAGRHSKPSTNCLMRTNLLLRGQLWRAALLFMPVVALSSCAPRGPDHQTANQSAGAPTWPGDGLPKEGWEGVPLKLGKGHLFEVEAVVGWEASETLVMLLDSGASWVVLDGKAAERLRLPLASADGAVGGLGNANVSSQLAELKTFRIGSFTTGPVAVRVLDLSAVNQSRALSGDRPIDGIIGATYLIDYMGVISYPSKTLFLRRRLVGSPKAQTKPHSGKRGGIVIGVKPAA